MSNIFFHPDALLNHTGLLDFGSAAPTWVSIAGFVLFMVLVDLWRVRIAYRQAGRSATEARQAMARTFGGSVMSCVRGLLLSLLMGLSAALAAQYVVAGVIMLISDFRPGRGFDIGFAWGGMALSLVFAMVSLFALRCHEVPDAAPSLRSDP
jgi:hypothetical protein